MKRNAAKTAFVALCLMVPGLASAQFNTIRKSENQGFEIITKGKEGDVSTNNQVVDSSFNQQSDPIEMQDSKLDLMADTDTKYPLRKKHLKIRDTRYGVNPNVLSYDSEGYGILPNLTITNLLEEIRRNGIQHEKIVLAQAILETGWFTSSVCRNKNNLFGLTNPRTGQYYEFRHWTESVRAYYDKVQYRCKGGNYLLWLKNIGYAEDPRYVSSLIRILRQYMM